MHKAVVNERLQFRDKKKQKKKKHRNTGSLGPYLTWVW